LEYTSNNSRTGKPAQDHYQHHKLKKRELTRPLFGIADDYTAANQ